MTEHPDNPYPKRGETNVNLLNLTQPLQRLAKDTAVLMDAHGLDSALISLNGDISGSIALKKDKKTGLTIKLEGSLGGEQNPTGTPYYAHYNGEFFWRPSPDSDDFVKNGDNVKSGQLVGWAMGESKDMSFGLRADQNGVIHLIASNATKVKLGETLLYFIEGRE